MARPGRPLAPIVLSEEDRAALLRLSRRPTAPHGIATRARIVLLWAEGRSNTEVATRVGVDQATVRKWRGRFLSGGIDALSDESRPGVPRTYQDDAVEALIVKTLTEKPKNATHWSTRDMAKATGMSQPTVSRIWKAFGLKPWATDTFKLSEDPFFVEKVRDVVGLYMNPPRACGSGVRGREDRDSGARPHPADPPDATGSGRAPHARLRPLRRH